MKRSPGLLRAFRHPLLIFSILALLLNDHVLKATASSAFTGKLSDFAGLFFFPFLLGVALQALACLVRRRLEARQALLASFGLCAALFIPIKTLPEVNALASELLAGLFGPPLQIALDPADLTALVMFLPAWGLCQRLERGPASVEPGRMAYAALGLGALASLATSPCMTVPSIQRLVVGDSLLYASTRNPNSGGYVSEDSGQTWAYLNQFPLQVESAVAEPAILPLTLCDPLQPQTCYRIDGQPQVEQSLDGGESWQVAWRVLLERFDYIERAGRGSWPLGCGKKPDLKTFDMLFLPGKNTSTLVVAVGNDGLVLHSPSTGWQRTGISTYTYGSVSSNVVSPTPWAARSGDEAFQNIQPEWLLALLAGYLLYLGLSAWAWIFAARHRRANASHKAGWAFGPLWVLAAWILLSIMGWAMFSSSPANIVFVILQIAVLALPLGILVVSLVVWRRAGALVTHPGAFRRQGWLALLAGVAVFGFAWACLLLWAFGSIVAYGTALLLAFLAGLAAVGLCAVQMRRGMLQASVQETPGEEA
jgi:hypothetical protein